MVRSMTGYGSAKGILPSGAGVLIEVKSVNNRYLDVNIRSPRTFLFAEENLKSIVSQNVSRGKVDVFITIENSGASDTVVKINSELVQAYLDAFNQLETQYNLSNDVSVMSLSRITDILVIEKSEQNNDEVLSVLSMVLFNALNCFNAMRAKEGERLKNDISSRICEIEKLLSVVEMAAPNTVSEYKKRLEDKIREVLNGKEYDESRIITEVAIFADHVAVDEETVRLHSHINSLREMLEDIVPVGRKMDFLIQEFNREANTIGSKCQDSLIAQHVVNIKSEIEKIREQIQNIE